ncbi:type IV pilus twitching motility protein PilT [Homoserinimonas sp. A520]
MSENVFDLSVDIDAGVNPTEPSYEPTAYLPSSVPNQPTVPLAEKEAPLPPAPPAPPAPPPAAEFLPTAVQPQTVEVPSPPPVSDAVSQALWNAPPPQAAPENVAPQSATPAPAPAVDAASLQQAPPPEPPVAQPVASMATMAPPTGSPVTSGPVARSFDSYQPVADPVNPQPPVADAPAPEHATYNATPTPEEAPAVSYAEPVVQPKTEAPSMSSPAGLTPAEFPPPQPSPPSNTPTPFESRRDANLNPDPDLDEALQKVLMTSGSDLHITADAPPMIRVDGALKPIVGASIWSAEKVTSALLSILTPSQKERFDEALEFDFAYTLSANARFRVNFYWQRNNMGAAFRLIPTEIKSLRDLGVPEVIGNFAKLARGLVLVTGPTGSGKSTTLAGLIDVVNRNRADHIMTVEDPIEFLHSNHKALVNQREVGHDTHSFAAALKHVLRQDPDVILVGELRDLETISVALTAAETGHLVFATLHTQDAPQTIDRIIDVYPPHQQGQVRAQLAATLQGVVCQTLVKRASGQGRVVATEVLVGTHAVANLIREGKTYQVHSAMQAGRDLGMHTMDQHLADLVNSGQITYDAAVEKAHDLEVLKRLVTRTDAPSLGGAMSDGVNYGDRYSDAQF